ncbi:hypothetical protein J6590_058866 [Homalodisca vitripennis]|nr:hypothetical protein J6590_058866 [Homalodisca vitripennis]
MKQKDIKRVFRKECHNIVSKNYAGHLEERKPKYTKHKHRNCCSTVHNAILRPDFETIILNTALH